MLEHDKTLRESLRRTTAAFEALREEMIEALRDCGFSEDEIFKDLDSSPYGRKDER